jgi:hypothetical protein
MMAYGNLSQYGDPFDPSNELYGRDPGSFASTSMLAGGMAPKDGWMYRGTDAPKVPEGQKGYYVMTNSVPGMRTVNDGIVDQGSQDNTWRFVGEQEAAPQQQQLQQQEAPLPKYPDGDIYEDNDYWQKKARAEVEGINKMPGVFSDYADISLMNPRQIENIFYPPSWQEEGVQKTIGPNGQNIAPQLQQTFSDAQAIDTKVQSDFPTLINMLTNTGQVDGKQRQTLLDMITPKKLDTSFGGPGGMGGGNSLLSGMFK